MLKVSGGFGIPTWTTWLQIPDSKFFLGNEPYEEKDKSGNKFTKMLKSKGSDFYLLLYICLCITHFPKYMYVYIFKNKKSYVLKITLAKAFRDS